MEVLIQSIYSCIIRPAARRPDLVLWVTDFRFVATETAALLISFVTIFSDCDIFLPSETDAIFFEIFGASAGAVSVFAIAALPCRLQWILADKVALFFAAIFGAQPTDMIDVLGFTDSEIAALLKIKLIFTLCSGRLVALIGIRFSFATLVFALQTSFAMLVFAVESFAHDH